MDKNFSSIEVECECGKTHELSSLNFFKNKLTEFVNYLDSRNIISVRLFVDSKLLDDEIVYDLKKLLKNQNIKLQITNLSIKHAEVFKANYIEFFNEEHIIVYGDDPLIELVKYYAFSVDIGYSIFLYKEFYDFTFSKFARLYDGICYGFYSVCSPESIVYYEKNGIDIIDKQKYLFNKKLAYFENFVLDRIEECDICNKINSKLKKVEKLSCKITKDLDAIYSLIFIGRAMSFFNCTKDFFSAEIDIANVLEVLSKKDFMYCYDIACKLVFRTYTMAISTNLKTLNLNLNRRIGKIKNILNLPVTKCLSFIKKQKSSERLLRNVRIVQALKYTLLDLLENDNLIENVNISPKILASAIYLAPEFSLRYSFLNMIRDLGYLENLI